MPHVINARHVINILLSSQAPYNDGSAASGFVGMKPSTTKAHLVRAVLESLAFRIAQLYNCVRAENSYEFNIIRYNILQLLIQQHNSVWTIIIIIKIKGLMTCGADAFQCHGYCP